jgi:carboxyl-terminal processing protease
MSDIVVPGMLSEIDIGEKFGKYPLANDSIKANFDDDLSDVPVGQRNSIRLLYKFNLQPKLKTYLPYLAALSANSKQRIDNNKNYMEFIKDLKSKNDDSKDIEPEEDSVETTVGKSDLQLAETYNILKDLLYLSMSQNQKPAYTKLK